MLDRESARPRSALIRFPGIRLLESPQANDLLSGEDRTHFDSYPRMGLERRRDAYVRQVQLPHLLLPAPIEEALLGKVRGLVKV